MGVNAFIYYLRMLEVGQIYIFYHLFFLKKKKERERESIDGTIIKTKVCLFVIYYLISYLKLSVLEGG